MELVHAGHLYRMNISTRRGTENSSELGLGSEMGDAKGGDRG